MAQWAVEINVGDTMMYITVNADINKMLKDKFVKEHWALIENLAMTDDTVCLFDNWMIARHLL